MTATLPSVSSKVSAYLQHLQDKSSSTLTDMTSPRHSALDRRRKRANQVRESLLQRRTSDSTLVTENSSRRQRPEELEFTIDDRRSPVPVSSNHSTTGTYVSSSSEGSSADTAAGSQVSEEKWDSSPTPKPTSMLQSVTEDSMLTQTTLIGSMTLDFSSSRWFPQDAMSAPVTPTSVSSATAASWMQHHSPEQPSTIFEEEDEQDSYISDHLDLNALIAEASARWKTSVEQVVQNTTTRKQQQEGCIVPVRQTSTMSSSPMMTFVSPNNQQYQHQHIVEQQQAEIDALRARISLGHSTPQQHHGSEEKHDDYEQHHDEYEPVMELIDAIPVEQHFEVHLTERQDQPTDDLTVWSGWTQAARPTTPVRPPPPLQRRPDADEASHLAPTHRVRDRALQLSAANGATRMALYTGPMESHDIITGVGVLKFPETGDVYMGEVVKGEMHGRGTYVSKRKKALKGFFDHNVFVQWDEI
jgi:hypothetical protein